MARNFAYIVFMDIESLRDFCRKLPFVTEDVKWGDHLCFSIAGKLFVVCSLDAAAAHRMSFKCSPERFAELVEREGIIPAPYMARNFWVALETFQAMRDPEIRDSVRGSYRLKVESLPKKIREQMANGQAPASAIRKRSPRKKAVKKKTKR